MVLPVNVLYKEGHPYTMHKVQKQGGFRILSHYLLFCHIINTSNKFVKTQRHRNKAQFVGSKLFTVLYSIVMSQKTFFDNFSKR